MAINRARLNNLEYLSLGYYFAISQNTSICSSAAFRCAPVSWDSILHF